MYTLLIIIHLFVSFIMIGAILLQSGKGAEIGAAFGGSSQTIFGSRGAATFLSKMTVGAAVIFMLTSLTLAFMSKERSGERSLMSGSATQTAPAPATPLPPAPAASTPAPAAQAPTPPGSAASPAPPSVTTGPTTPSTDKK